MILEGYFENLKKAQKALSELEKAGFNAHLSLNEAAIEELNVATNFAGSGSNTSLSDLVLNSGNHEVDIDKAPIYAADPNVSGMAGFEEIINSKHKIVVETNENNSLVAMEIIEKIAGSVINANS